jgi:hypothetical protein
MENDKIVEEYFNAIERSDFAKAESYCTKDLKVTGVSPEPLSLTQFLGVHKAFNKGMPDFRFNYKIGSVSQNIVETKVKLSGTHTKEIPSPIPGVNNIPPTNKSVRMPEEKVRFTFKDNKISGIVLEKVAGGGLPGVLKQLGVEVPMETHSH